MVPQGLDAKTLRKGEVTYRRALRTVAPAGSSIQITPMPDEWSPMEKVPVTTPPLYVSVQMSCWACRCGIDAHN